MATSNFEEAIRNDFTIFEGDRPEDVPANNSFKIELVASGTYGAFFKESGSGTAPYEDTLHFFKCGTKTDQDLQRSIPVGFKMGVTPDGGIATTEAMAREIYIITMMFAEKEVYRGLLPCKPIFKSHGDPPVIVSPLAWGTLHDAIRCDDSFGFNSHLTSPVMLYDLLSGLSTLHNANLEHQDLKAGNILVFFGPSGEIRLRICDYGSARQVGEDIATAHTVGYTPPETLCVDEQQGQGDDVWAVGCVAFEMMMKEMLNPYDSEAMALAEIVMLLGKSSPCFSMASQSRMDSVNRLVDGKALGTLASVHVPEMKAVPGVHGAYVACVEEAVRYQISTHPDVRARPKDGTQLEAAISENLSTNSYWSLLHMAHDVDEDCPVRIERNVLSGETRAILEPS